ncbi:MAG: SDR family NAD(P)-dependent oxidoreductase [Angustibacter sp.]
MSSPTIAPPWTTDQIPDLSGLRAVVTGANSGIGLHTALELARHGADVVLACRDAARGEAAVAQVRQQAPGADVRCGQLDLADLASVRAFAESWRTGSLSDDGPAAGDGSGPGDSSGPGDGSSAGHGDVPRLDLLINNAGVMAPPERRVCVAGHELQLATNHLGHLALTALLWPALTAAASSSAASASSASSAASSPEMRRPSRVVTVSSQAHRQGRIDLADLSAERGYQPWRSYSQSKLANLLFTLELQRRADRAGAAVLSVAAHPGLASTRLVANGMNSRGGLIGWAAQAATDVLAQSAEAGSWPTLYAATMPDVRGGEYFGPDRFAGWRGRPTRVAAAPAAYDVDTAAALWWRSLELTDVQFPV